MMESVSPVPVLLPTPLVHQSQAVPSPGAVGQTLPLSHTNRFSPCFNDCGREPARNPVSRKAVMRGLSRR